MSSGNCLSFFDPLIDSWDVDLETFSMVVILSRRLTRARTKKLEYTEMTEAGDATPNSNRDSSTFLPTACSAQT